jgi:hypothetical protein
MIKKILPLAVGVLIVVLVVLFFIQAALKNTTGTGSSAQPTLFPIRSSSRTSNSSSSSSTSTPSTGTKNTADITTVSTDQFQKKLPIQTADFTISYADRLNKYVVTLESDNAGVAYNKADGCRSQCCT